MEGGGTISVEENTRGRRWVNLSGGDPTWKEVGQSLWRRTHLEGAGTIYVEENPRGRSGPGYTVSCIYNMVIGYIGWRCWSFRCTSP